MCVCIFHANLFQYHSFDDCFDRQVVTRLGRGRDDAEPREWDHPNKNEFRCCAAMKGNCSVDDRFAVVEEPVDEPCVIRNPVEVEHSESLQTDSMAQSNQRRL